MVQAWFMRGSGVVQVRLRRGPEYQVQTPCIARVAQGWFDCGSCVVQVWFRCGSSARTAWIGTSGPAILSCAHFQGWPTRGSGVVQAWFNRGSGVDQTRFSRASARAPHAAIARRTRHAMVDQAWFMRGPGALQKRLESDLEVSANNGSPATLSSRVVRAWFRRCSGAARALFRRGSGAERGRRAQRTPIWRVVYARLLHSSKYGWRAIQPFSSGNALRVRDWAPAPQGPRAQGPRMRPRTCPLKPRRCERG